MEQKCAFSFSTYLDAAGEEDTTVQVHPDVELMEQDMKVMAQEIGAAFEYVELTEIETEGRQDRPGA